MSVMTTNEQTAKVKAFVAENLIACSMELLELWRTGTVKAGKLRELESLCEEMSDDAFDFARQLVLEASLKRTISEDLRKVADSVHEYECLVPWVNGEPVINATGLTRRDCKDRLSELPLISEESDGCLDYSLHPAVIVHKTPEA